MVPGVDLKVVAARTAGFAGADLANLVNEAALLAARNNKEAVEMSDFNEAIDRLIAGLEKKRVMNAREREMIVYHESGHAIVASALPGLDPVHKISIVQRGFGALGYTMQLPLEDRYLMTRTDLQNQMAVLLAGRSAEEIALGEISTGAQNDLQRATDIARAMVTQFGMSEDLGTVNYEASRRNPFLDINMGPERGAYGEETAQRIDVEVKRLLEDAHDRARQVIGERRQLLEVVTRRLLEKEVIEGDELMQLIAEEKGDPWKRCRQCNGPIQARTSLSSFDVGELDLAGRWVRTGAAPPGADSPEWRLQLVARPQIARQGRRQRTAITVRRDPNLRAVLDRRGAVQGRRGVPFLVPPMDEFANRHVPLDAVWGEFAMQLQEQLLEAASPSQKLDVIERVLTARLERSRPNHPAVAYAIRVIERDPALIRIADVTGQIGLSHRRFLDLFAREVGLTPKLFCRIRRFQRVLRRIRDGREVEWADVALSCGYHDQAHFIKDFQAFSGISPSTYVRSMGPHANHVPL